MPVLPGSVMFRPAATATAASAQLPPFRSTSRPHCEASGCVHETMPFVLWTTERRDGKAANVVRSPAAWKAEVVRGILAVALKARARWREGAMRSIERQWNCKNVLNEEGSTRRVANDYGSCSDVDGDGEECSNNRDCMCIECKEIRSRSTYHVGIEGTTKQCLAALGSGMKRLFHTFPTRRDQLFSPDVGAGRKASASSHCANTGS